MFCFVDVGRRLGGWENNLLGQRGADAPAQPYPIYGNNKCYKEQAALGS